MMTRCLARPVERPQGRQQHEEGIVAELPREMICALRRRYHVPALASDARIDAARAADYDHR
jgi:hypothetical protein